MKDDYLWDRSGSPTRKSRNSRRHWALSATVDLRLRFDSNRRCSGSEAAQAIFLPALSISTSRSCGNLLVAATVYYFLLGPKPIIDSGPGGMWLAWRAHPRLDGKRSAQTPARQSLPLAKHWSQTVLSRASHYAGCNRPG